MGLTINELVTKFKFEVDQAGLNNYDDAIKKARNTEKKSTREKLDDIDKLFKQFNDNKSKEAKIEAKLKKEKDKWLNDHNKLELKYIKEKESIRNKINALNVKDANTRVKESKAQIEADLKGYKLKQDAVKWLADLKARKANDELKLKNKIDAENKKSFDRIASQALRERDLQRRTHQEKLDQIRRERSERLAMIAETGAMMYGAKVAVDKLLVAPTRTAGNLEEVYNFLEAFGETDAQGLKRIKTAIKSSSKLGVNMPVDIGNIGIELGKAGYKEKGDKKEISSLLPLIVGFARASGGEPKQAAELMTNAFSSMKITDPQKQKDMTDAMVAGLNISKLDFADFQYGFKYAAGSHAALGGGLPDLIANLAILANRGIKGSTAGTGLRTIDANTAMMMGSDMDKSLQGSRRNAKKWGRVKSSLKELGIDEKDILDKDTGMLDTAQFFSILKSKMNPTELKKLGKSQRFGKNQILFDLFGKTAMNAAYFLTEDTEQDRYIRDYFKKGKYRGETGRVLPKLNKGLNFQEAQANISFEFAKEAVGKQFLPIATKLLEKLRDIMDIITNMSPKNLEWAKTFGNAALVLTGVALAIRGIGLAVRFLTASNPLVLALSLIFADLINYFTGAPTMVEGLATAFQNLQNGAVVGLIKGLEKVINYFRELFGYSQLDFNINNRNLPSTPQELLPPSMRKDSPKPKARVPFLSNTPNISKFIAKPVMAGGGGATFKSSSNDTVVTIHQVIHANNSGTPERIGQIVQDVTKKNLTMINSMKAQRVTAF